MHYDTLISTIKYIIETFLNNSMCIGIDTDMQEKFTAIEKHNTFDYIINHYDYVKPISIRYKLYFILTISEFLINITLWFNFSFVIRCFIIIMGLPLVQNFIVSNATIVDDIVKFIDLHTMSVIVDRLAEGIIKCINMYVQFVFGGVSNKSNGNKNGPLNLTIDKNEFIGYINERNFMPMIKIIKSLLVIPLNNYLIINKYVVTQKILVYWCKFLNFRQSIKKEKGEMNDKSDSNDKKYLFEIFQNKKWDELDKSKTILKILNITSCPNDKFYQLVNTLIKSTTTKIIIWCSKISSLCTILKLSKSLLVTHIISLILFLSESHIYNIIYNASVKVKENYKGEQCKSFLTYNKFILNTKVLYNGVFVVRLIVRLLFVFYLSESNPYSFVIVEIISVSITKNSIGLMTKCLYWCVNRISIELCFITNYTTQIKYLLFIILIKNYTSLELYLLLMIIINKKYRYLWFWYLFGFLSDFNIMHIICLFLISLVLSNIVIKWINENNIYSCGQKVVKNIDMVLDDYVIEKLSDVELESAINTDIKIQETKKSFNESFEFVLNDEYF